jgi:hypothetical protein
MSFIDHHVKSKKKLQQLVNHLCWPETQEVSTGVHIAFPGFAEYSRRIHQECQLGVLVLQAA